MVIIAVLGSTNTFGESLIKEARGMHIIYVYIIISLQIDVLSGM